MTSVLPYVWACIIALAVLIYVVLDGFDLGIGLLFPFSKPGEERDHMMNSVAPVWDGNETWLVMGGGGLLAAFPLAYSIILPALYAPIIAMLLGLVLRGVAFEFRWRTQRGKFLWDWSFFAGSAITTMAQGIALGALVQGIPVANRAYAGGWWNWLTPFSLLTGIALLAGYALLGACWLCMKTTGPIQLRARAQARILGVLLLVLIALVSLWTPFINAEYFKRWFTWPFSLFSFAVPGLMAVVTWQFFAALKTGRDLVGFMCALGFFLLSYLGLGLSFFPYIVPPTLTIVEAAAPDVSLSFLMPGTLVLLPIILAYTGLSYWVFRGKVNDHHGYH